jgi:hypothetical protein
MMVLAQHTQVAQVIRTIAEHTALVDVMDDEHNSGRPASTLLAAMTRTLERCCSCS